MSLRFQRLGSVPECTANAIRSIYRKKVHPYVAFADAFSDYLDCDDFTELYSNLGKSAIHPARIALAMLIGTAEGLSDRQIAEKVGDSIVWKYLLRLPLDHPGFDHTVLTKFRDRALEGGAERLIFDKLLHLAEEKGFLGTEKQRTDSTHVLSKARDLSRLELAFEMVKICLEDLAQAFPQWLFRISDREWCKRYFDER